MEYSTRLPVWPLDLQFPPELDGKIRVDAERCRLSWRGFMTEAEMRQLLELHDNARYRKAVWRLFERCNRLETTLTRRLNLAFAVLSAICLIGAALMFVEWNRTARTHNPGSSMPTLSRSQNQFN